LSLLLYSLVLRRPEKTTLAPATPNALAGLCQFPKCSAIKATLFSSFHRFPLVEKS